MFWLLPLSITITVYLILSKKTYSYSGWFPQSVRRGWIKRNYPEDYVNWENYHQWLSNGFSYYKILNPQLQSEFMVRTTDFMNQIDVEAREELKLDNKMRLLIGAHLAQITFGYQDFRFRSIKRIILYPEQFYSKFLDAEVKGLTYGTGYIFLSWKDFEVGYEDHTDKVNLGLHEFAHALMLEKPGLMDTSAYETFYEMGKTLFKWHEDPEYHDPLFREYAFTNHNELWAVCVEVYFERPEEFMEVYPRLYSVIGRILNQDPIKIKKTAYAISDESTIIDE